MNIEKYEKECSNCNYGYHTDGFWDCNYVKSTSKQPKITIYGDCLTWKSKDE